MTLLRPDRDLLRDLIDQHQVKGSPYPHGDIGREVRCDLESLIEARKQKPPPLDDEACPYRVFVWLVEYAAAKQSHNRADQRHYYYVRQNGDRHRRPGLWGTRQRKANGLATNAFQSKLWREMTQQEHSDWLATMQTQVDNVGLTIAAHRRLQTEWIKYPHARTAEEVCHLAGIDPEELAI